MFRQSALSLSQVCRLAVRNDGFYDLDSALLTPESLGFFLQSVSYNKSIGA